MSELVISARGLVKSFGRTRALDGLDLASRAGEVHGFLGPNGAGKTSTIRILLGLLRADRGEVRLLGGDPWRDAASLHRRLAYVPGDVTLWPDLTGGEIIDLLGRLRGRIDQTRTSQLLDRFELNPTRKAHTYSKGNRQKVALVAALASEAELRHLTRTSLAAQTARPPRGLAELPGVHDVQLDGTMVRCRVDATAMNAVLRYLTDCKVRSLVSQPPTLEELFLRHDHLGASKPEPVVRQSEAVV